MTLEVFKMRKKVLRKASLVLTCLGYAVCLNQVAVAGTITDGFEGAALSPIWSASGPGTETLTTSLAHSGIQSLQLSTSLPLGATVQHDFGSDQTGSVSVWVQGQSLCCGTGLGLQIEEDNTSWLAIFQQSGNNNCNSCFAARVYGSPETADYTFNASASAWNLLQLDVGTGGVTFSFDGAFVFTNPSVTKFRLVDLTIWAGFGGTAYFDDFSATTTNASPEPSSWILFGMGLPVVWALRRHRLALFAR